MSDSKAHRTLERSGPCTWWFLDEVETKCHIARSAGVTPRLLHFPLAQPSHATSVCRGEGKRHHERKPALPCEVSLIVSIILFLFIGLFPVYIVFRTLLQMQVTSRPRR